MNKATRALLYYLRRYLAAHPDSKKKLQAIAEKHTGATIPRPLLWRHIKIKSEPGMMHTIIYLTFLHRERAIVFGKKPADPLFTYKQPQLMRAEKT